MNANKNHERMPLVVVISKRVNNRRTVIYGRLNTVHVANVSVQIVGKTTNGVVDVGSTSRTFR